MKKVITVALCGLLTFPFPATADNCRRVAVQQHHAVPAYTPSYVAPVQAHGYDLVQPFAIPVPYLRNDFYSVQPDLAMLRLQKELVDDAANKASDRAVEKMLNALAAAKAATGPAPADGVPPQALALKTGSDKAKVREILTARCVQCHAPGLDAPDLSGDPDLIPELARLKALRELTHNRMPKGKDKLSQEEFNVLGKWADQKPAAPKQPVTIPPAAAAVEDKKLPEKSGK